MLMDDLDGSRATQTIRFAIYGTTYEIHLNDDHAAAFEESFEEWIAAARVVTFTSTGGPEEVTPPQSRPTQGSSDIRSWARAHGFPVADRGRLPARVHEAFDRARREQASAVADEVRP